MLALLRRTADWQLAQAYPAARDPRGWIIAPFCLGVLARGDRYHGAMLARFESLKREPARRVCDADDHCVIQAFGRCLFWSRGNGWVAAGLCHVLELLPADHPDRPRYLALYRDMMQAVLAAQQPIGAAPEGFDPRHNDWFGTGAFLLAGSQVYRLAW